MKASNLLLADLCYKIFGTSYSETDIQSISAVIIFMNMGSLETTSLKMRIGIFLKTRTSVH